jgi:nucleoside-diphosphate-sugar epimerase
MSRGKVTILGINGHIGHHAAKAFVAAGWQVTGFGRSNRTPSPASASFRATPRASRTCAPRSATARWSSTRLNLPYRTGSRAGRRRRYGPRPRGHGHRAGPAVSRQHLQLQPRDPVLTPDLPQQPPTPRGADPRAGRKCSALPRNAAICRSSSCAPAISMAPRAPVTGSTSSSCARRRKGRAAIPGRPGRRPRWAYLPDVARAFEKLAWHRRELGAFETFHFAGDFVTPEELGAAIAAAAPAPGSRSRLPLAPRHADGAREPADARGRQDGLPVAAPDGAQATTASTPSSARISPRPFARPSRATVAPYFAGAAKRPTRRTSTPISSASASPARSLQRYKHSNPCICSIHWQFHSRTSIR